MFTQLLDFFTYSILGASLVTSMAITPDAAFELTTNNDQLFTEETTTSSLILKSNTPIKSLSGTLVYDQEKLTITSAGVNNNIFLAETEAAESNQLSFTITTNDATDTIGVHEVLDINFFSNEPGEQVIKIRDLTANAAAATAVYAVPELSTNVTVLARTTSLDLNADADYTLSDLSLFALYFTRQNPAADFNNDGSVGTDDLQLLLKMF